MKLPVFSWLLPDDVSPDDRILVIQSGSPQLLSRAVEALSQQIPGASLTVLLQKNMRGLVSLKPGVEYLDNPGPRPDFVSGLRKRRFDRIFVLFSNEPGYWKLKLLPILLGARAIFVMNENLDWFSLDLRHSEQIAAHARWRMESSITFAGEVELSALWGAAKFVAYPAVLAYLLGFERLRTRRAAPGTDWKTQNRPDSAGMP